MIEQETDIKTVEKIIDKLGELPVAPAILNQALQLTSNLDSNINEISKSISVDQSLSAKVIRMSNSALYGRMSEITSLQESIKVLGLNQVKSIIISASTYKIFKSSSHEKIAELLWQHSVATALGAKLLAQKYGSVDKEEAYLCGLLHDIGKLVLLQIAPNVLEEILAEVKESGKSIFKVEERILGFTHADVAQVLLQKWGFPDHLIEEVANHHLMDLTKSEPTVTIARLTAIANTMAKYIGASFYEAFTYNAEDEFFIGSAQLEIDDYIAIRTELEEIFHKEMNSFRE